MTFVIGRLTHLPHNWRRKMADGDVLQIVAGHQAFAPGGGVQQVSLLGPFHVAYNDPGFAFSPTANNVADAVIPAGSLLLKAMLFITDYWGDTNFDIPASPFVLTSTAADFTTYDPNSQFVSDGVTGAGESAYDNDQTVPISFLAIADVQVQLQVGDAPLGMSSGAGDIYLLIATPAS